MKYYLLHLKFNNSLNKSKIDNVRLINKLPNEELSYFESVPVLAYEQFDLFKSYMVDVLTGKKIYYFEGNLVPELTYTSRVEVSEQEKINISEIYKSMSKDDLNRYIKGISEIENNSKIEYYKSLKDKESYDYRLKNADKFLNKLCTEN